MRTDRELALKLRLEGKSYRAIKNSLGVSLSTLSGWFKNDPRSIGVFESLKEANKGLSRQKIQMMNQARRLSLAEMYKKAEGQAKREFQLHKNKALFIVGLSIYWCDGDKASKYNIRIVNSDPARITIFRAFLLDVCNIEDSRIKSWLLLYPDLDERALQKILDSLGRFT